MRKEPHKIQEGEKFNYLTAIKLHHKDKRHRQYWLFQCDCGNQKVIHGASAISGNTKSCGCLLKKQSKLRRLPNNLGVIRQIILQYKKHASRRNIEWKLKEKEVIDIIKKNCYYCDLPPSNNKITKNRKEGFLYSGIDRVDNSKPYEKSNCVPCCEMCNRAKRDYKKEEFLNWIKRVYQQQWGDL
jgi:hypothetical protein